MTSKIRTLIYLFVLGLVMIMAGIFYYNKFSAKPSTTNETKDEKVELKVRKDLYQNVSQSRNYGNEILPNEPGFGRLNPFTPYK